MTHLKTVDDASFDRVVGVPGLSVVDFSADWCGPCRVVAPVLEQLAREYESKVEVLKLDADANPATVVRFGVRGLPTILFFRDGQLVDQVVGAVPRSTLQRRFEALVGS